MDWLKIFLFAYMVMYVAGVGAYIANVGKPRTPVEPGVAAVVVAINMLVFVMLLLIWQRL